MKKTPQFPSRLGISKNVLFREIDGEAMLLNLDSGIYFGLDSVGTKIWNLMTEGKPLETIAQSISSEYDVSENRCRTDLFELAEALRKHGLVEVLKK